MNCVGHEKFGLTYPSKLAFPGIDEVPMPAPPAASAVFVYNKKTDKNNKRGKQINVANLLLETIIQA